jgi:hypothetical protein
MNPPQETPRGGIMTDIEVPAIESPEKGRMGFQGDEQ